MKKIYIVGIATLLVIALVTMSAGPLMAQGNTASSGIQMVVTVNGLEKGEGATLRLSPEI